MKRLEKLVKKTVTSMIDIEIYGWPPVCIGMIYQPERPKKRPEQRVRSIKSETYHVNET